MSYRVNGWNVEFDPRTREYFYECPDCGRNENDGCEETCSRFISKNIININMFTIYNNIQEIKKYIDINSIINANCLEAMSYIPDKSIHCILADLPYGTTSCSWDSVIPFEPLWNQYKRIIKENGVIILTASQPFTSALVMTNKEWFKYEWIWEKERPTNIFLMKNQPGKVHENILIFYNKQPTYNPITEPALQPKNNKGNKSQIGEMNSIETLGNTKTKISENYNNEIRNPRSVLKINRGTRGNKKLHPTQKPIALGQYLIKTYTNKGDVILDNVFGSGSFLIAAILEGRNFIGIEKDEKYFTIGKERIQKTFEQIKGDNHGLA